MPVVTLSCSPPQSVNRTKGAHWSKVQRGKKRLEAEIAQMLIVERVPKPIPGDVVYATAHLTFPVRRPRDEGNYRAPIEKALGDALVPKRGKLEQQLIDGGMIEPGGYLSDDTPEHFTVGPVTFSAAAGIPTLLISLWWGPELQDHRPLNRELAGAAA